MSQPENELRVALEEFMPEMELALVMEQVILPKRVAPAWCKLRAALASRAPATTPTELPPSDRQSPEYLDAYAILDSIGKLKYQHNKILELMNWKVGWRPARAAAPSGKDGDCDHDGSDLGCVHRDEPSHPLQDKPPAAPARQIERPLSEKGISTGFEDEYFKSHIVPAEQPAAPEVEALAKHWLFAMHCNHEEETDTATCACGWNSNPHSSVGLAAEAWAAHALGAAQDKPTP